MVVVGKAGFEGEACGRKLMFQLVGFTIDTGMLLNGLVGDKGKYNYHAFDILEDLHILNRGLDAMTFLGLSFDVIAFLVMEEAIVLRDEEHFRDNRLAALKHFQLGVR